jgi:hypothetical protein
MRTKSYLPLRNSGSCMESAHQYVCKSYVLFFTLRSWFVTSFRTLRNPRLIIRKLQKSALATQKQEQTAAEEAEKRLKAALTAKREPSTTSRVASPSLGTQPAVDAPNESKPRLEETSPTMVREEYAMEVDQTGAVATPPVSEVCSYHYSTYSMNLYRIVAMAARTFCLVRRYQEDCSRKFL